MNPRVRRMSISSYLRLLLWFRPVFIIFLMVLSVTCLTACNRHATQPGVRSLTPRHSPAHTNPYGVYDIQVGHGQGAWKKSPESLAR